MEEAITYSPKHHEAVNDFDRDCIVKRLRMLRQLDPLNMEGYDFKEGKFIIPSLILPRRA